MFETLFGSEMPLAARFFIAFLVVLGLIGLTAWLYLAVFEEKGLVARFGEDYEKYRGGVPLLFPRLSAYVHAP